ncbi:MAG: hypothetical protein ACK2T3_11815, partial [Candidatus Promineifilaceae bacterium]
SKVRERAVPSTPALAIRVRGVAIGAAVDNIALALGLAPTWGFGRDVEAETQKRGRLMAS